MIRKNPYPLVLRCLRESGITAFFTRSSAANIPVNMNLCEKLGLDKDFYSVSIPLGATINMDGAAITITVMALTVANTMGITVDIPTAFILGAKIKAISELRETGLGTDDKSAPFNPELVAKMLIQWVKGDKINTISSTHPHFVNTDTDKQLTEFVTYINQLRFKASWGLSALEGIVKGNENEMKDSYIPSYVYYGVDNSNALAMRMLGIPRSLSSSLSNIISGNISEYSFSKLRNIIRTLSLKDWDNFKPKNSNLTGDEWKHIVSILMR